MMQSLWLRAEFLLLRFLLKIRLPFFLWISFITIVTGNESNLFVISPLIPIVTVGWFLGLQRCISVEVKGFQSKNAEEVLLGGEKWPFVSKEAQRTRCLDETCMMSACFLLSGPPEENFLGRCRKIPQVFPVNLTQGKPQLLLSYLEFRALKTQTLQKKQKQKQKHSWTHG